MNKQPELTPWFPADVKPERPGWYQRKYEMSYLTAIPDKWTGTEWLIGSGMNGNRTYGASDRKLPWRGLASDPKAAA